MNTRISALLATALVAIAPFANADNVALNANVTYAGPGFGGYSAAWGAGALAQASTVTDGLFLPDGQQWNIGSVFWNGDIPDTSDVITVTLNGAASITSLFMQADNNDFYSVSYEDTGGTWHALPGTFSPHGTVSGVGSVDWGLGTDSMSFGSAITATAFQITASGGDGYYAVSEFQATGEFLPAVPEPTSGLLMLAGLGALASLARRRSAR